MAGTLVLDTLQNGAGTYSTSADNVINGCAKAWVNFNGTTTPVTIRAQYNVSSVTKNGNGDYTVNFTNPLPSDGYSIGSFASNNDSTANESFTVSRRTSDAYTTSACRILSVENTGSATSTTDSPVICVQFFI